MSTREPEIRPKVGVGVMIIKDGKILLGRRKGAHGAGYYAWAGGHLEFGETLEECAIREVEEETGMKLESLQILCINNIIDYNTHYVDIEFIGQVSESCVPKVKEPDRIESWEWFDQDNLPKPLFKAVELALQAYQNGIFYQQDES